MDKKIIIPEVDMNTPWTCTDQSNHQYGRKLSPGVYQFKEWCGGGILGTKTEDDVKTNFEKESFWVKKTIVLSSFSDNEIRLCVDGYYNSLEHLKKVCGKNWEWIVAECIFEVTSGIY